MKIVTRPQKTSLQAIEEAMDKLLMKALREPIGFTPYICRVLPKKEVADNYPTWQEDRDLDTFLFTSFDELPREATIKSMEFTPSNGRVKIAYEVNGIKGSLITNME